MITDQAHGLTRAENEELWQLIEACRSTLLHLNQCDRAEHDERMDADILAIRRLVEWMDDHTRL